MKLFLALVLAAGAFAQPWGAQWMFSDALGNSLGPAPLVQGSKAGRWTLRVETRGSTQEQVLFDRGVEQFTRLVDRDAGGRTLRVREIRGSVPIWEATYKPETGLVATETMFVAGVPAEISHLTFEGRLLIRREARDADGAVLYVDRLYRWPDGTLRRVERDGPSGPLAEAAWSYGSDGRLAAAWAAGEAEKRLGRRREWTFDGGVTSEILASETQTLLTRVSEAGDFGGREILTDASGRVETRTTDTAGRLTGSMVTVKEELVEVRRWVYDGEGRLVESSVESAGPPETWRYEYNADGTMAARLLRAGVMVREVVSRGGEPLIVSLYDRGSLFLVETWAGGRRVKETYYQNGAVIRERVP